MAGPTLARKQERLYKYRGKGLIRLRNTVEKDKERNVWKGKSNAGSKDQGYPRSDRRAGSHLSGIRAAEGCMSLGLLSCSSPLA